MNVDRVVGGISDVRAAGWVDRFGDEVGEVAVRVWVHAEDSKVADVTDVHRRRGDLGGRPLCRAWTEGQVERLRCVEVPFARRRVRGRIAVGRTWPGAAAGIGLTERIRGKNFGGAQIRDVHLSWIAGCDYREPVGARLAGRIDPVCPGCAARYQATPSVPVRATVARPHDVHVGLAGRVRLYGPRCRFG